MKLNLHKDTAILHYMGAAELTPDAAPPVAHTHSGLVRTLAAALASCSAQSVATCHALCVHPCPGGERSASEWLVGDVVAAVEGELERSGDLRQFSARKPPRSPETVVTAQTSVTATATALRGVYGATRPVVCVDEWGSPFGFVWALWVPLMAGCVLHCDGAPPDDCVMVTEGGCGDVGAHVTHVSVPYCVCVCVLL